MYSSDRLNTQVLPRPFYMGPGTRLESLGVQLVCPVKVYLNVVILRQYPSYLVLRLHPSVSALVGSWAGTAAPHFEFLWEKEGREKQSDQGDTGEEKGGE